MSYAQPQAVATIGGSIRTQASARLRQQEAMNERLEALLSRIRVSPPHPVDQGPGSVVDQSRPLNDVMDRMEAAQDRANTIVSEIETYI